MIAIATFLFLICAGALLFTIDTRAFFRRAKFLEANGEIEVWADNDERCTVYLSFFKTHRKVQMSLVVVCILVALAYYLQGAANYGIMLLFISIFHYSLFRKAGRWRTEAEKKIEAASQQPAMS